MKKIILSKNAPAAIGPYSQAIEVDANKKLYFFSGQIAINPQTANVVDGGIEEQTTQVMKNIQAILTEIGASFDDVVKTTIFLKNLSDFNRVNQIYGSYVGKNPPARSTVEVSRLPKDALIEIEVTVAK